ncbi:hypothetical protein BO86DRAFT_381475 [Aspergillus japonicus CBS 114.51]|uniref:Uncharacterized protein n=1 Tax=Aspergillus japonicus CBS 114.51 TaxID=1448312 RepID=A0A8T8WTM6_ASPJA|nr:hypothetical protein BO86DRAFT_381475 [Aspergillus japonicus CBS 114.51]RAH79195.1 hypothetical protein BO86DRAFT_381475 [Aspergillus japonicus CBS 114.51]
MSDLRILYVALLASTREAMDDILEMGKEIEAGPTQRRQFYVEYERRLRMALSLLPKVENPDASLQQLEEEIQQPSDESALPQDIMLTTRRVLRVIKARYEAFLQDSLLSDDAFPLIAELIKGLDDRAGGAGDDDDDNDGEQAVKGEEGDCKVKAENGEEQ